MEYENMRLLELKSLARDRGLRNYSRIRKAELVALLQNNGRAQLLPHLHRCVQEPQMHEKRAKPRGLGLHPQCT